MPESLLAAEVPFSFSAEVRHGAILFLVFAMHAGLECGVIGEKYPSMQMVSFGPTIVGPHSPHERVQMSSVQSFWNYLKQVLENL